MNLPNESGINLQKRSQGAVKMRWRIVLRLLVCLLLVCLLLVAGVLAGCHETVMARPSIAVGTGITTHTDPNIPYVPGRINKGHTSKMNGAYAQLTFCETDIVNAGSVVYLEVEKVWQDQLGLPLDTDRLYLYLAPVPEGEQK
jgi:hypothetical protein